MTGGIHIAMIIDTFYEAVKKWKEIRELVAKINDAGLEKEAEAIWKKTAPADFKTWYPKKLTK
jgi:hypothetical protein